MQQRVVQKPRASLELIPKGSNETAFKIISRRLIRIRCENRSRGSLTVHNTVEVPRQLRPFPIGLPPQKIVLKYIIPGDHPVEDGQVSQLTVHVPVLAKVSAECIGVDRATAAGSPHFVHHFFERSMTTPTMVLQRKGPFV